MSARYRALDFDFVVDADDPTLTAHLGELFEAVAVTDDTADDVGTDPATFCITTVESDDDVPRYAAHFDDAELVAAATAPELVDAVVQRVNARAIASPQWLVSHASGISHDGDAMVFAAQSESGKSTLAAGLVRAGFAYVSDEAVAFDWETGCISPYPKPISLDQGSWSLFPELDPRDRIGHGADFLQWHVPVGAIGPGRLSPPCRARWLVFPKYEAGAETGVVPITRGEALIEWSKHTFRFNEQGRAALTLQAAVIPELECHRMVVGDLDDAIACVAKLVGA